jgi:hypothetical protein
MAHDPSPTQAGRHASGGAVGPGELRRVIAKRIAYLIRQRGKACCFHPEHVTPENYQFAVRQLQRSIVEMSERYAADYERLSEELARWEDAANTSFTF